MDYEQFVDRASLHAGLSDRGRAESMVRAVIEALGELIDHVHREELAAHLPAPVAQMLRRHAPDPELDEMGFVRRVSSGVPEPDSLALEHATAVLEAFAAELAPEIRRTLVAQLPEGVREWLRPRFASSAPPPPAGPGTGHRLADGRSGSSHPISEAAPKRAQSGSVARSADPHADTRISSATGMTQEREHEDLAEVKPGSKRWISGAKD
jgi:uncharacterized protein (DUF2267 family)